LLPANSALQQDCDEQIAYSPLNICFLNHTGDYCRLPAVAIDNGS